MRASSVLATLAVTAALAGCAGTPPKAAPDERQVKVDESNIAEAQRAGYKIVTQNGKPMYCRRDLNTGSHVRYSTSCLTEEEWRQAAQASQRGVEAMSRRPNLPKGN
jgi:hypothetical protein